MKNLILLASFLAASCAVEPIKNTKSLDKRSGKYSIRAQDHFLSNDLFRKTEKMESVEGWLYGKRITGKTYFRGGWMAIDLTKGF